MQYKLPADYATHHSTAISNSYNATSSVPFLFLTFTPYHQ